MKKMPTIFIRNFENMRERELTTNHHPDCDWVFNNEGVATKKYDGTCTKIEDGMFLKRREVRKGKETPVGFIQEDFDKVTEKRMGWIPVTGSKEDQRHMEAFYNLNEYKNGTYELIGPKVQGNPEKMDNHILLKHSEAEIYANVPRDFDGIKDWLSDKDIEGIVFHHPDGRMGKIKKKDFGFKRS